MYKTGDRFKIIENSAMENQDFILAQVQPNTYALIGLTNGNRYTEPQYLPTSFIGLSDNDMNKILGKSCTFIKI